MTPRKETLLERMHKTRNQLTDAVKTGTLSVAHSDEVHKAVIAVNKILPTDIGSDDGEDEDILANKFQHLSRSWGGPLEGMMEDSRRRQELKDIFPSLEDGQVTQLLVEAQLDREVHHLVSQGSHLIDFSDG